MPGSSVSIADYLAIDIACRHTAIQRSVIADYFDITVNALNARLRTCTDRLKTFPDFVAYGTNLLEIVRVVRPDFDGRVHPIWELSRKLLQSYTVGSLAEELSGFQDEQGSMYNFLALTDFRVDGRMPMDRPDDEMLQLLPSGRKRKHEAELNAASGPGSPKSLVALPDVKTVPFTDADRVAGSKKSRVTSAPGSGRNSPSEEFRSGDLTSVEKTAGRGSRTEPYSQHELCCIYIARKIRMLDWDTISWSLSRFKTPTVGVLSDARSAFDQHHDLIVETMKLSCWPEDSMFLIACAASECISALERGHWAEEIKGFRSKRGMLYHLYMQKRIERIYRKSFEIPSEKRRRRRHERVFGYEGISIEEYENLPEKKKIGGQIPGREPNRVRKRRTKEELQQAAEEKAAARALLKANGLKANGEALADKRKAGPQAKVVSHGFVMPPTFADALARVDTSHSLEKAKKTPRRKYDIPEIERIAFAGDIPGNRRMSYDVRPEDRHLLNSYKTEKSKKLHHMLDGKAQDASQELHGDRHRDDLLERPDQSLAEVICEDEGSEAVSKPGYDTVCEPAGMSYYPGSPDETTPRRLSSIDRSAAHPVATSSLLKQVSGRLAPNPSRKKLSPASFEYAAASPLDHLYTTTQSVRMDEHEDDKPRSSMSLSALLN